MGNKQAVVAISTKANELEGKISALEKSLSTLQGSVKGLQDTVDGQKAVIDTQKAAIGTLQATADEYHVVRVINQLTTDINGRDFKSSRSLFTDEVDYDSYCVTQETPRSKLNADDLVDNLKKSEGVYKGISWIVSSPQIAVNGDEASAVCQFRANHFQAHNEKGADFFENQGTFRMVFTRHAGTWRIKLWKFTSLASQSGNPRLHDIAAKYAAEFGPPMSPAPRTSGAHMNVGVAIMVPGKNPADLRHTVTEKKKEEPKVEIEKVALKKTEPIKKAEPAKVEIPKTRLASSSMSKKDDAIKAAASVNDASGGTGELTSPVAAPVAAAVVSEAPAPVEAPVSAPEAEAPAPTPAAEPVADPPAPAADAEPAAADSS